MRNPLQHSIQELLDERLPLFRKSYLAGVALLLLAAFITTIDSPTRFISALFILIPALVPGWLWVKGKVMGLPLVPAVCLIELAWYLLPVLSDNESLIGYTEDEIFYSAFQLGLYFVTIAVVYNGFCRRRTRIPKARYRTFSFLPAERMGSVVNLGLLALIAPVVWKAATAAHGVGFLWDVLPFGAMRIIEVGFSMLEMLAVLFLAFMMGQGALRPIQRVLFLVFFVLLFLFSGIGLMLANVGTSLVAFFLGLTLGRGKMPWVSFGLAILILTPLNYGKFEMRGLYWGQQIGREDPVYPWEVPEAYAEWFEVGLAKMAASEPVEEGGQAENNQSLVERFSNLQMLLTANRALAEGFEPLYGATYATIPELLIPRVLHPDKPRAHAGQAMLNTHFGLQSEEQTFETYIAWGLLPEAVGNFGLLGPLFIGFLTCWVYSRVTHFASYHPVLSLRFAVGALFSIQVVFGSNMVASVWVTSIFQSMLFFMVASVPFLAWRVHPWIIRRHLEALRQSSAEGEEASAPAPGGRIPRGPARLPVPAAL